MIKQAELMQNAILKRTVKWIKRVENSRLQFNKQYKEESMEII